MSKGLKIMSRSDQSRYVPFCTNMHSETCLSQTSLGPAFTFRIDKFSPSSLAKGYNPLLSSPLERGGADRNPCLGARRGADRNPWLGARGGADRNPWLGADCNPWLAKMPIYRLHGMLRRSWSILVGKCLATVCRS